LRYRYAVFNFDDIDAFVYPIREDRRDINAVLGRKIGNFRKEMELAQREGAYKSMELFAPQQIRINERPGVRPSRTGQNANASSASAITASLPASAAS
jgi:hypothetical protein